MIVLSNEALPESGVTITEMMRITVFTPVTMMLTELIVLRFIVYLLI
jgi:hypothetical protein